MEKITICIIETDLNYMNALLSYMNSYCRNYTITFIDFNSTDEEQLLHHININKILLINYEYLKSLQDFHMRTEKFQHKSVILLDSFAKYDKTQTEGFNLISKYTDIRKLINYIDNYYYQINSQSVSLKNSLTKLILCLGLSGGSGLSSVSYAVSSDLAKHRSKRVFFMSLDIYECENMKNDDMCHERLHYSLIQNNLENKDKMIENHITETNHGVWKIPASMSKNAFHEFTLKEKKKYIKNILDNNKFEYLILDAGNKFDEFTDFLIVNADEIIVTDKHNSPKVSYMPGFLAYIDELKTTERSSIIVENCVRDNDIPTYENAIPLKYCEIVDKELFDDVKFSSEIKKVTDYLV